MTRFDLWFSTLFLGAAAPILLSLLLAVLLPLIFPAIAPLVCSILGVALGVVLDFTLLRHNTVMAYVTRPFILALAAVFYAAWLLYMLDGCPLLNMLIGPALAWIIGRRCRLNDQSRGDLRAILRRVMPWMLLLLAAAFVVGIISAANGASYAQLLEPLFGPPDGTLMIAALALMSLLLLALEYFLVRLVARKSYDHRFIAPSEDL